MPVNYGKDVSVQGIRPEILLAIQSAGEWAAINKHPLVTVTSALDGQHMETSLHYSGAAVDLAIPGDHQLHQRLADFLAKMLTGDYDVLDEMDHVHVEYQPRKPEQ